MLTKSSLEAGISEVSHTLGQESFKPTISIQNLNFNYKNQKSFRLGEINLEIKEGEFVAIVGPSGAGKTTLIDLLLGIITPSSGQVLISGRPPRESVEKWPGFIGYVPQNVFLANTSILNNIIFEYSTQEPQNDLIESVISKSHLTDFINMLPDGLETQIQNSGNLLSGGQKQRIGIARALYTDPKLLIMDEATSALDSDSEATISSAIRSLRGKMTVIVVAHRLSTIVEADKIYYLDKGKILGSGNFQELRSSLSDFNRQAELMGF
jgi:ABC-type bacteriocin/lantibiotic exporter with double-glycine peptidase domain